MNSTGVLELNGVSCARASDSTMRDVSLVFAPRTLNVLSGEDAGKNLLLRVLGLLEIPDTGDVLLHGAPTRRLTEDARDMLRNRHFGFLFAQPFLLPAFSTIENVAMPLFKISGIGSEEARPRIHALLEFTGMTDLAHAPVGQLPIFDQQRVALARALANGPDILIVENIGAALTDEEMSQFAKLLHRVVTERGATVLTSASARALASIADRVIEIADGRIQRDMRSAFAEGGATA